MSGVAQMLEEKRIELALKLTDAQAEIRKLREALSLIAEEGDVWSRQWASSVLAKTTHEGEQ
jgi:aspartate aminotransferase-like enzyme